jgi:hypothetical protein
MELQNNMIKPFRGLLAMLAIPEGELQKHQIIPSGILFFMIIIRSGNAWLIIFIKNKTPLSRG